MPANVCQAGVDELTVVIDFESIATYESAPYHNALAMLGNAVERDIGIVEGIE